MKRLVSVLIARLMAWCDNSNDPGNVMNSIRINALVSQLADNGLISKDRFERDITGEIYNILCRRSNSHGGEQGR